LNDTFDLRFAVTAKDLRPVVARQPRAAGGKTAQSGTLKEPTIARKPARNGIQHEGVSVQDIDAAIDFRSQPPVPVEGGCAHPQPRGYKERTLEQSDFQAQWPSSNYDVRLDARALGMSLATMANGAVQQRDLQGQLRS